MRNYKQCQVRSGMENIIEKNRRLYLFIFLFLLQVLFRVRLGFHFVSIFFWIHFLIFRTIKSEQKRKSNGKKNERTHEDNSEVRYMLKINCLLLKKKDFTTPGLSIFTYHFFIIFSLSSLPSLSQKHTRTLTTPPPRTHELPHRLSKKKLL